jgi:potassium efflux system protein
VRTRFLMLLAAVWMMGATVSAPVTAQSLLPVTAEKSDQTQSETQPATRAQVEAFKLELNQIEIGLERRQLTQGVLASSRQRLDEISAVLRKFTEELTPRAEALRSRLKELGPEPDAKATPESAEIAKERSERDKALKDVDEVLKLTRAASLQAAQLIDTIIEKRREAFQRHLFERSSSLLAPGLWVDVVMGLPKDMMAFVIMTSDTMALILEQRGILGLGFMTALLFGLFGVLLITPQWTQRFVAARFSESDPAPLRKALRACVFPLAGLLLPALSAFLVIEILQSLGMLPTRLEVLVVAYAKGLAMIGFTWGLVTGLTSPTAVQWQWIAMPPLMARHLRQLIVTILTLSVAGQIMVAVLQTIAAGWPLMSAVRGVTALLIALFLAHGLHNLAFEREQMTVDETGDELVSSNALGVVRLVMWMSLVAVILAILFGYIAFAGFLIEQLIHGLQIFATALLVMRLAEEGLATLLAPQSTRLHWLEVTIGLPARSIMQLGILVSGLAQIFIIGFALLLVIVPWGVQSDDLLSSLKAVLFGLTIGDMTLSLATVLTAVALFVVAIVFTQAVQRFLRQRYLPLTQLDSGIKNSLTTGIGYIGFVLASALALSTLGLSLDKLALVAGALSVGIGFGLQSIVNNFVSGLILLWERSVRVGDLVVVGDDQGHVKRINVRATEIQTFDRSVVIVPNSNLISGVVKNKVHSGRLGRVLISLPMPRDIDVDQFAAMVKEHALSHADVLEDPPPAVYLKQITETTLVFELIGFVADVDSVGRVSSDLSFAIWRDVRALKMIPASRTIVTIEGAEHKEAVLKSLGADPA